jgi:signal transduction histidine kinase
VPLSRIINTATFRLTALYALLFAIAVAVLGVIVYQVTAAALEHRLDARIEGEMTALKAAFAAGGLARLIPDVRAHQQTLSAGPLEYLLLGADGERLAGNLATMPAQFGWSNIERKDSDGDVSRHRVLAAALVGGARLAIGANREDTDEVEHTILDAFLSAFGAVVALGIIVGIALSHALLKRVETIRRTAEAIIAGDFTQRVPVRGTGDEFDRLSLTLNRMLDRITELMESLRQVSADIAHDLKTPLAHLRQRLETTQRHAQSVEEHNAAIDLAIAQADEILAIFSALLRIAQIEAGTRRADFRDLDLSAVFANVVDAFAPAVADAGKHLDAKIKPAIRICGDRELLTQMLANLIENAIRHTPAGTRIEVSLGCDCSRIVGTVSDNGPGTPAEERERIFQRFYRLERSWSTPGSGLGLSLVKAVADLHGIVLEVRDAEPGFLIVMRFPEGRQSGATTTDQSLRLDHAAAKGRT